MAQTENTAFIVGFISRATIVGGIVLVAAAYAGGFDVGRIPHGRGTVTFTDATGAPLGTVSASDDDHAAWVPLAQVAPSFRAAIVAAEDARFDRHGAVDVLALLRAARDALRYGAPRSGGSTIEMQLARSLWPTPSTLGGKLRQIFGAERIVMRSSREAILEAYVNRIPMGGNLYGVQAAARTYFGVDAGDLDLAQAALLAAIPNDPTRLSPYQHWSALRARQRYVLARMAALGNITGAQAAIAGREELHVFPRDAGLTDAQHFLFFVYPQVASNATVVRTTIDRGLQRFVAAQVAQVVGALAARHVTDGAALVVDNRTGDVVAYVGSPDYYSDLALGRNDGVQALRQPGSSLKPFTYELALERRTLLPTSILEDVPTSYPIPGGKLYQPADYSTRFSGPVRVRYALANSLNVPAVGVLSAVGVDALLDRLHDLGFSHLDKPASYYGLGLTLGSGEVSLWELTHAYVTVARVGAAIPLRLMLDAPRVNSPRVGDDATWALVTDMIADPHARAKSFGVHSVLELPFPSAVKTGTSSDFRDTWTVGFSRDYTVGVWVGNFDGSPMRGVSGVTGAGPLWNRIMLHLHERRDPDAFPTPSGYVLEPICATTGHRPGASCPAVVREWIAPRDLAHWRSHAPTLGSAFQIVFPHDGDTFALNPPDDPSAAATQRIELRAVGSRSKIVWTANARPISLDSSGATFWPLRLGTWTLTAGDGAHTQSVTIHVIRPPHGALRGFTVR
ncbi:MAG TPA: penicillin-binding protein 1C [Verrucomicrobiae bacterium]|nr:penicillin-binding protein 1C [Verrucomicrobiae bacterium]